MDNQKENIINSSLPSERKAQLIDYYESLKKHNLPVFFDSTHIKKTFKLENDIIFEEYVENNIINYLIEKRNGENRAIIAPNYDLKQIQRWILLNILEKTPVSESAHGFVKGRSILTNALEHKYDSESWILSIDIIDFFGSIDSNFVTGVFEKFSYNKEVSESLKNLCTFQNQLPQGFPTSPYLANLYLNEFDIMCKEYIGESIKYTRYADDLTFSGLKEKGYTLTIKKILDFVDAELEKVGLIRNSRKTRVQKKEKKKVTGLLIKGQDVSVSNKFIREINNHIYYCKKYGVIEHLRYRGKEEVSNFKGYLYGKVYFVMMISPNTGRTLKEELDKLDWN